MGAASGSSDYEPEEKKSKFEAVPLKKKIEILQLRDQHPNWSQKTLRTYGGRFVPRIDELIRWRREVLKGGTKYDKSEAIRQFVFDRFKEARMKKQPVETRTLQVWALQALGQFFPGQYNFTASTSWVIKFKRDFRISQRKVTKYCKPTEHRSLEEIDRLSREFQEDIRTLTSSFNLDFVINTDQMGCEYRANINRTLEHTGHKTVEVHLGDVNKVTHSYTVQYSITASGKLLPKVYICLQEVKGTFGPQVQRTVDGLCDQFRNVCVTASKSGKLSTQLYDHYTVEVLKPYVGENKFVLIQDTWGGQKKPELFTKFQHNNESTCEVRFIPPNCTPLCQPLDCYLHRQMKYLLKRLQNCTYLMEENRQINSREDCIKIHSLIHRQLSAPVFKNMIQYSWFSAKLIEERDIYMNVIDALFSFPKTSKCSCSRLGFIKCAWCRSIFCVFSLFL